MLCQGTSVEAQGVPQAVQLNGASPLYCLSCRSSHSFVVGFMRACLEKVFLWVLPLLLRHGISGISVGCLGWQQTLKESYSLCCQDLSIFQFRLNLSVSVLPSTLLLLSRETCVFLSSMSSVSPQETLMGNQTWIFIFLQQPLCLKCSALQIPTTSAAPDAYFCLLRSREIACFSCIKAYGVIIEKSSQVEGGLGLVMGITS